MKKTGADRRISPRYGFRVPLRVRLWKSEAPEQRAESVNLSPHGVYFATDAPLREGETVEILLKMPQEITDEPTTEWRCTGHVVRVERGKEGSSKVGIGVRFDCYEVSRTEAPEVDSVSLLRGGR
jgi:hypothetical protein